MCFKAEPTSRLSFCGGHDVRSGAELSCRRTSCFVAWLLYSSVCSYECSSLSTLFANFGPDTLSL
jgi:hypothetical protein